MSRRDKGLYGCRIRAAHDEHAGTRWLSGEVKGDNNFCPNANVFATLRETAARQ